MTNRKPTPSLLYSNASSSSWARALSSLSSLIDANLAPLCMQQWQRARVCRPGPAVSGRLIERIVGR